MTSGQWLIGLGVVFLVSSLSSLLLNKRQREAVLNRLHFRQRRASGASTPPRSISPTKDVKQSLPSKPDYRTAFPPSRRSVLPDLAATASASNKKILIGPEPSTDFLMTDPLPTTRSFALENPTPKYTPTGFSTAEIKAMGDFPDYSILSGVPLPKPYEQFDPAKALPRPYRPFRWAYHQTMCKFTASLECMSHELILRQPSTRWNQIGG